MDIRTSVFAKSAIAFAVILTVSTCGAAVIRVSGKRAPAFPYPYRGARFSEFVSESFREGGSGTAQTFYDWMDGAYTKSKVRYAGKEKLTLEQLLDWKRNDLAAADGPQRKTREEVSFCAWLHKMVKGTITKFSLDRGFEFRYTVSRGERQCFLQSVLIAGMLQRAGVDAGVAMVYQNAKGDISNNGHAVTLVKLPNGTDIIVDASEPFPFAEHRGLFVRTGAYGYVNPSYAHASNMIKGYRLASKSTKLSTSNVRPLDLGFIRSQFWYYRGERAPGGLLAQHPTRSGLQASLRALKMSVKLCSSNPLALCMLGRTYLALGDRTIGRKELARAASLYSRLGWMPESMKEYAMNVSR